MSDLFRCRASTWSAGAVPPSSDQHVNDRDPDPPRGGVGFDYGDCASSVSASATAAAAAAAALALHSANASGSPIDRAGNTGGSFHFSPTELTTQEFSNNSSNSHCHPVIEKTPSESTSDYAQNFFTSSPPSRGSRDWNTSSGAFATSNFSVLSVAGSASSPFGHHADNGANGSLLTPYGNSSPYTNGSCSAQQQTSQPGLHSGSPSSVGSQLSSMMSGGLSTNASSTTPTTPSAAGGNGGTSGSAAKRPARRNPWGSETYSDLIAKAIESYPEKQATLQQIYDYISTNYSYFRERSDPPASAGWKNSIRHNLSLHDKFVKCPKASESSKSSYWRLNANSLNRPYVRRRTCSLDTPGGGGGNVSVGGKKSKSRLGSSGGAQGGSSSAVSSAKRSAHMGSGGGRGDLKSGMYGDDLLSGLDGHASAAAVRSHLNSLPSGTASAFSIPGGAGGGGETLLGLKGDHGGVGLNHHHPWANSGFLTDRKMANDELSALCKMHASDPVSSSSLSLMSSGGGLGGGSSIGGGYEFQMPRVPPSSSARSSFSSSGIGSERGSTPFFSPPPPLPPPTNRYHLHHAHFSYDQQSRYGSTVCDTSPNPNQSTNPANNTYDQLTGVLTGSTECLEGGSEDPFLREDSHQLMSHHHHHHHQTLHQHVQHHPAAPQINSHLHNLLMCGDSGSLASGSGIGSDKTSQHHQNHQQQSQLSSQDDMELRISLEIANRVKSGEMSSTMQQWAAAAASAARTVENGA